MSRRDSDLMLRAQQGDSAAFEELVKIHQKSLVNFFYRLVLDQEIAEDCAQEVFLRIYRSRHSYKRKAKFTTFMYKIARNLWIDRLRHRAVEPQHVSLDAEVGGGDSGNCALGDLLAGGMIDPSESASENELVRLVREVIDALPEEQKMIVILAEVQGLRYADVASIMGIPIGTVKSRMHAIVMKLREALARRT